MAHPATRTHAKGIHPVHAVLLSSILPLFAGALLSDWAYASTYQVQWTNFAAWLIAGAILFTGFALLWAAAEALRGRVRRRSGRWLYPGLLAATLLIGVVNALVHAKDGWAAMPEGLLLSALLLLLALAAIWAGFSARAAGADS